MLQRCRIGLSDRQSITTDHQIEDLIEVHDLQDGCRGRLILVGDQADSEAGQGKRIKQFAGTWKQPSRGESRLEVHLPKECKARLRQSRFRGLVEASSEATVNQLSHPVPNPTLDFTIRDRRQTQSRQHPVGSNRQVSRGIDECAIEVEENGDV